MMPDVTDMPATERLRHQSAYVVTDKLLFREAEYLDRRRIDAANDALVVNDDDRAGGCLQRRFQHLRVERTGRHPCLRDAISP
jgi:hypothetical protein